VAVVGAWRPVIAVLIEGDERADGLRIGNALGHSTMIPAAAGRSVHAGHGGPCVMTGDP
jgi:hypothetical protein